MGIVRLLMENQFVIVIQDGLELFVKQVCFYLVTILFFLFYFIIFLQSLYQANVLTCTTSYCSGNGLCSVSNGNPSCYCFTGYTGTFCETSTLFLLIEISFGNNFKQFFFFY
jgi:hypothetical protein